MGAWRQRVGDEYPRCSIPNDQAVADVYLAMRLAALADNRASRAGKSADQPEWRRLSSSLKKAQAMSSQ